MQTFWVHPTALAFILASGCATPAKPRAPNPAPSAGPAKLAVTPMREPGVDSLQPLIAQLSQAEADAGTAPNDPAAWLRLSHLLRQAFRTQEAARAAWRAVELESTFATWTNLGHTLAQGDVFMAMGGSMGAFQAFKMAARQATDPAFARQGAMNFLALASADFQMGHDEQALELIDEAESLAPELPLVHYNRALVLSVQGQQDKAQAAAQKALSFASKHPMEKSPADEEVQFLPANAEAIVAGRPGVRPPVKQMGEALPPRFWEKPPSRGQSLALEVDPASTRYFPLVPGVTMRLQVPTNWAQKLKATDKAVHLRMTSPAGELRFVVQITLFPVVRENFNLQAAALAGRQGAQAPDTIVGPLLPIERKDGLAFWFDATDTSETATHQKPGEYRRLVQLFAYAKPFVFSATLLFNHEDDAVKDALLQMGRTFGVFHLDPS